MRRPRSGPVRAWALGCALLLTTGCTSWVEGTAHEAGAGPGQSAAQPVFVLDRTITFPDSGGFPLAAHPDLDGRPPVVLWAGGGRGTWGGDGVWAVRATSDVWTDDDLRTDATLLPGLLTWFESPTGHGMTADGVLSVVAGHEDGGSSLVTVGPGPAGGQAVRTELQFPPFPDEVWGSVSGAFAREGGRRYLWRAGDFEGSGEVLAYDGDVLVARRTVALGPEEWGSEDRLVTSPNGRWVALVHGGYGDDDVLATVWDEHLAEVRTVPLGIDPQLALDDRGDLYDYDDQVPGTDVDGWGTGLFRWSRSGPAGPSVVPLPDVQLYTESSAEPRLALVPGDPVRYALLTTFPLGDEGPDLLLVDLERAAIVDRIRLCPPGTAPGDAYYGPPELSADGSELTVLGSCGAEPLLWVLHALPPS